MTTTIRGSDNFDTNNVVTDTELASNKGLASAWVLYDGINDVILDSYNITNMSTMGTGDYRAIVNLANPNSSACICSAAYNNVDDTSMTVIINNGRAGTQFDFKTTGTFNTTYYDSMYISVVWFGGN